MSISYQGEPRWRLMAVIEVREDFGHLASVLKDPSLDFRLQASSESPRGYAWFDLLVDADKGERRCARTAHAVLTALQRIADDGDIPEFRIVNGHQWVRLGEAAADEGGAPILNVA
ncbi:MAG: hypothetical protein ACREPX_04000 [Rhodanobacteraceae bacterium]